MIQENDDAKAQFKKEISEERAKREALQKKQKKLEKENAELAKRLQDTNAENFEAFCSDTSANTDRVKPVVATAGAVSASSGVGAPSAKRLRSGSVTVPTSGLASSADPKSTNALSQFVC